MVAPRGIRAGSAHVEIGVHDKLTQGLKAAEQKVRAFGQRLAGIGASMAGAGASIIAPLAAATKLFSSMGDQLHKMSKRTGFSVESLSEMKYAAELSGTSIESLEAGLRRMQMTVNDAGRGLSTAKDALAAMGLTLDQVKGKSPEQQFRLFAEAISRIPDATTRAATAMMVFGRSGTQLLPMFEQGAAGLAEMAQQARDLGLTMSTNDADAAAALSDAMTKLWGQIKMAAFQIGSALAPAITEFATAAGPAIRSAIDWVKNNRELVVTVGKLALGLTAAGVAMIAAGKTIGLVATALKLASVAAAAFKIALTLLAAHPIVAALLAIVAAGTALYYLGQKLAHQEGKAAADRRKRYNEWAHQENERRKKINARVAAEKAAALAERKAAADAIAAKQDAARKQAAINARLAEQERRENWSSFLQMERSVELQNIRERANSAVAAGTADSTARLIASNPEAAALYQRWQRAKRRVAAGGAGSKSLNAQRTAAMSFAEFVNSATEGRGLTSPGQQVDVGRSVAGTFSSERLGGLGASSPLVKINKQIAKAAKQTAKNTKPQPMGP